MQFSTQITLFALAASVAITTSAAEYTVTSPDNSITVNVGDGADGLSWSVSREGRTLVSPSPLGMEIQGLESPKIKKGKVRRNINEHIEAPFYRQNSFDVKYNELTLTLNGKRSLTVRAFDDGVAYRFSYDTKGTYTIADETFRINIPSDVTAYLPYSTNDANPMAMAFQNFYDVTPLSHAQDKLAFLPTTLDYGNGVKLTILESDLKSYPGMFLKADTVGLALEGEFARYPKTTDYYVWRHQLYVTSTEDFIATGTGSRTFPWRILAITDNDTEMPVNNLVYALAEPSKVADTSWIKPGKVAWDWWNDWGLAGVDFKAGINNDTYKYYIDFAAENGIEYVVLDEGWFDSKTDDMLTVIPEINLSELIEYGKNKGVSIVLWTVFNILDDQLEEACKKYSEMGVKGFKVDFLDRDDQTAIEMTYRIAEACARHNLFLDYHGIYKPTGINRTYPNVLNFEGVFGMEEVKWTDPKNDMPLYDVTFPYIRMMAGNVDYTPGAMTNASRNDWKAIYYNPMSMGTRVHQLATYIVHDSPFTMLCDSPTNYRGEEESVDFITSLPVVFDNTKVIDGKMGEYIVTARKKGDCWYIGGMTNWDGRDIVIDFSFLTEGTNYEATIFTDGVNADKQGEDYKATKRFVRHGDKLPIHMASGGGVAMKLIPAPSSPLPEVTAIPDNMRARIPMFYQKYAAADGGLYAVSSEKVSDKALQLACQIVNYMLMKRPDVRDYMASQGCHVMVIGKDECTCDIPEFHHVCTDDSAQIAYINWRARGFGGAPEDTYSSSCGEENLLALPNDKYLGENIMIHEFAHLIHTVGIVGVEPDFENRLQALYEKAKARNLWDGTYALSNKEEYFAEAVQSFFNCNRYAEPANGVHNDINRRGKLKLYDPEMYDLLCDYFYETEIPILNQIHR